MKRLKKIEVINARGKQYVRLWQYAGRGGQAVAIQLPVSTGETPADVMNSPVLLKVLEEEFGLRRS